MSDPSHFPTQPPPDWIPADWITDIKTPNKGKNVKVGASEILQYGETAAKKSPDWLPAGWTEEIKIRNGRTVKTYVDPLWGHRFYSKPQVLQYLGIVTDNSMEREATGNSSDSNLQGEINGTPELLPQASMLTTHWENEFLPKQEEPEMPDSGKIVAEKTLDWLPAGWTEEVKLSNGRSIKCYIDSSSGRKFYSRTKVLEYLRSAQIGGETSEKRKIGNDFDINLPVQINDPPESLPHGPITELESGEIGSAAVKSHQLPKKTIDCELPEGWITEVKYRKYGSSNEKTYKQYIDPVTGRKFLSKQKVFEYLGTVMPNSSTSRRKRAVLDDANSGGMDKIAGLTLPPQPVEPHNVKTINSSRSKERGYRNRPGRKPSVDASGGGTLPSLPVESQTVETSNHAGYTTILGETSSSEQPEKKVGTRQPQELPPGWIKEFKNQKTANKTRKIPYYIDPVSGYVFASLMDGWRYVESGDIRRCLVKPKKREEMGFATNESSPNVDKSVSNPPPQLLEGEKHVIEQRQLNFSPRDGKLSSDKKFVIEPSMDASVSNPSAQLLEGDKHVNTRRQTRFSPEYGKLISDKQGGIEPNMEGSVSTRRRKRFSPEDGKLSSDKGIHIEANVNKIVSNTPAQLLEGAKHVNAEKRTRSSHEDVIPSSSRPFDTEPNVDKIVSNTLSWLSVGAEHDNTQEQDHTPKRARTSPEVEIIRSTRQCDSEIVIDRVAAEGLPSGWIKEVRLKIEKLYTDPESGYVFVSQEDALCYLETGDIGKCATRPRMRDGVGSNEGTDLNTDNSGRGLPFVPASRPKIKKTGGRPRLQHLEQSQNEYAPRLTRLGSRHNETSSSKQSEGEPKMDKTSARPALPQPEQSHTVDTPSRASISSLKNKMTSSKQSGEEVVIERVLPEGLPPGWIKEMRIRKKADGIRKDVFYTDPVSGYVFFSQKDVLRYVETGDIRSCAMKPKTRDQLGLNQGSFDVSPPVVQKPGHYATKKELSSGKTAIAKRSLEVMDSAVQQKRQTRSSVASPAVMRNLELDRTGKPPTGNSVGSKRSLETVDTEIFPKRRQTRASASAFTTEQTVELQNETPEVDNTMQTPTRAKKGTKNATGKLPKEVPEVGNGLQKPTRGNKGTRIVELPKEVQKVDTVIQKTTKAEKGKGSSSSSLPKAKVSKKKTAKLKSETVKASTAQNSGKVKSGSSSSKTKKKTEKEIRTPPSRFSKRVLGLTTDTITNSGPSEQALTAKVGKSRKKKDALSINTPNNVASREQALTSEVENTEKNEGIPCPNAPVNVDKALTSEVDNSENNKNPEACDGMADNTAKHLETVPEIEKTEVEKPTENEDTLCPNSSDDVAQNVSQQLENVLELEKTNDMGGAVEAPSEIEVPNKENAETDDKIEDQTMSHEESAELSNKISEARENQVEGRNFSPEPPAGLSNKSTMEKQAGQDTMSQEECFGASNKSNEVMEDHSADQIVSLEQTAGLPNTSNEAMEVHTDDHAVSLEPSAEVPNRSNEAREVEMPLGIPVEVSNKSKDAMEDQTLSPEKPAEVSNKSKDAMEDRTLSPEKPAEVLNKSKDALEDQTLSLEKPAEVLNKSKDALEEQTLSLEKSDGIENQAQNQTLSQDQSLYQFGEETWSDPCLDFAFKTLTGSLPFEDNAQVQNIFQLQGDTSQVKTADNSVTPLDFDSSNARQLNDSNAQNGSEPVKQLPTSPRPLPDMNSHLPGGSETVQQQVDPEENARNDGNVLTLDNYAKFLF